MTHDRRCYQQFCGVARALDAVGERWTLLIVRNLLLGPRRFSDLLAELPGLTTNLLSKRLRELESLGIVAPVLGSGAHHPYGLTPRGAALEPVLVELARWGAPLMETPRSEDRIDIAWALLSLKARYRGVQAERTLGLDVATRSFTIHLGLSTLGVRDVEAPFADARVRVSPEQLVNALLRRQGPSLHALRKQGLIPCDGDAAVLKAFERAVS